MNKSTLISLLLIGLLCLNCQGLQSGEGKKYEATWES